jgi:hypothetical protein
LARDLSVAPHSMGTNYVFGGLSSLKEDGIG